MQLFAGAGGCSSWGGGEARPSSLSRSSSLTKNKDNVKIKREGGNVITFTMSLSRSQIRIRIGSEFNKVRGKSIWAQPFFCKIYVKWKKDTLPLPRYAALSDEKKRQCQHKKEGEYYNLSQYHCQDRKSGSALDLDSIGQVDSDPNPGTKYGY